MSFDQDELDRVFRPFADKVREVYGEELGFIVMAVSAPYLLDLPDGSSESYQPFVFYSNAAHASASCGLMAKGLEHIAEIEANPQIVMPEKIQ